MILFSRSVAMFMLFISLAVATPVFAQDDDLLLADTPVFYGKEAFLNRIEARTGGTRTAVGLVLSGGSARAFAHIGVLKRLEESGVVPDFIVANSMGSIIGLLYAAGLSPEQIYDLVSSTSIAALFDPTIPLTGGILDPGRFSDLLRFYLGELRLEELPIPILVACEDLVTKREILLAEGDFTTVMEAAYALPVFFLPATWQARAYRRRHNKPGAARPCDGFLRQRHSVEHLLRRFRTQSSQSIDSAQHVNRHW
ncbi:hypothetical protein MASR2M48_26640 [Spirochaetota bacterium]